MPEKFISRLNDFLTPSSIPILDASFEDRFQSDQVSTQSEVLALNTQSETPVLDAQPELKYRRMLYELERMTAFIFTNEETTNRRKIKYQSSVEFLNTWKIQHKNSFPLFLILEL